LTYSGSQCRAAGYRSRLHPVCARQAAATTSATSGERSCGRFSARCTNVGHLNERTIIQRQDKQIVLSHERRVLLIPREVRIDFSVGRSSYLAPITASIVVEI
jgi:hypothetical protein